VGLSPVHSNEDHVVTSHGRWISSLEATAAP
jgi:hypothetical protein